MTCIAWSSRASPGLRLRFSKQAQVHVLVVGTGLAGASAAATLSEHGLQGQVLLLPGQPPPRPQHRGPGRHQRRQELPNDGDSVHRLFYDTVKGGDFRSREANVTAWPRSASTSSTSAWPRACPSPANTAATSTTAPSAAPRYPAPSTPAARPASSSSSAPTQRADARSATGNVKMYTRREMLDLVVVDGHAGHRRPQPGHGQIESHTADAVLLAPAATATCSTCPPTPWAATSRPPGARTGAAPTSPTPATPRSTPPASRSAATTRASSPS
jgi:succinate dehydrogenase / fumarate reductase flavoprotein subunit